jgi:hypothetical protein
MADFDYHFRFALKGHKIGVKSVNNFLLIKVGVVA